MYQPTCTLHASGSVAVVSSGLGLPVLYLAVENGESGRICGDCDLQGDCDALFGPRGERCQVHPRNQRWHRVEGEQREVLGQLFTEAGR